MPEEVGDIPERLGTRWNDDPVEDEAFDDLDRAAFAGLVTNALLSSNSKRSNIVGITGDWGSGKSSVAHFVANRLIGNAQVVWIEPWMVSSAEVIVSEFFKELSKALAKSAKSADGKKATQQMYKYGGYCLDALSLTFDALDSLNVPLAKQGKQLAEGGKSAAEIAAKGLEALSKQPTLRESRDALAGALRKLEDLRIVVIIDDVDRLQKEEVKAVFQLIKACADLPRISYLIPYDPRQVLFALEGSVLDPKGFLEKIIGQSFDLPLATHKHKIALLDKALDEAGFDGFKGRQYERLTLVFDQVLVPGLVTIRNVKRFVRTTSGLIPGVVKDGNWNVDPGDFLALEFVRQFIPKLYGLLRDEEEPRAGGRIERMVNHKERPSQIKENREKILNGLMEPWKELGKYSLEVLERGVSRDHGGDRVYSAEEHRDRRFASPHYRNVYLGFSEARASVSQTRWLKFVNTLKKGQSLGWWLDELVDLEKRHTWTQIITDRTQDLPKDKLKRLLVEVFSWADTQPRVSMGLLDDKTDWTTMVYLVGSAILVQLANRDEAIQVLTEAIGESQALYAPAYLVGLELSSLEKDRYSQWAKLDELRRIAKSLDQSISPKVHDESIWGVSDPFHAVIAWGYVSDKKSFEDWHQSLAVNRPRAINYFNHYLGSERSLGGHLNWAVEKDEPLVGMAELLKNEELNENGIWARDKFLRVAAKSARQTYPYEQLGDEGE